MGELTFWLEAEFGYITYAMSEFGTWEEMLEDRGLQYLRLQWSFLSVRKDEEEQVQGTMRPPSAIRPEPMMVCG